jgi:hypothetical protein
MSHQIDRSQAERRALALSMVDGIWDMLMGLFFFVQAFIDPIEESLGTTRLVAYIPLIVLLPLGFLAFRWLKQRFTIPRIGLVKTSSRTNLQERRILIVVLVMVVFTGAVFIGASMGLFEQLGWTGGWLFAWGVDLLFGLLTFAVFCLLAYSLMAPRYYLFGALLGAAMPLTATLRDQSEWISSLPMMFAGLVMVLIGALVFGRFIRQYPLPAEEGANG